MLLQLQVPLPELLRVMFEPTQTGMFPAIGSGSGLMVTTSPTLQPVGNMYEITAVPCVFAEIIPVDEPIEAALPELVHVPPGMVFVNVGVVPAQIDDGPRIGVDGLTVNVAVAWHPEPARL